jgi:Raf kinase inhibitor-like YbhB/YbcL family protein
MNSSYSKIIRKKYLLVVILIVAVVGLAIFSAITPRSNKMDQNTQSNLQITSQAFKQGETIPDQYTCRGEDINPPLNITGIPENTKSLALIMHDPDALGSDYVHWLVWDIPTSTQNIAPGNVPVGAIQGQNGFGNNKYGGPCPPSGSGTHRYIFELYALDTTLSLSPDSSREKLQEAMKGHILAQNTLTGLVAAE